MSGLDDSHKLGARIDIAGASVDLLLVVIFIVLESELLEPTDDLVVAHGRANDGRSRCTSGASWQRRRGVVRERLRFVHERRRCLARYRRLFIWIVLEEW